MQDTYIDAINFDDVVIAQDDDLLRDTVLRSQNSFCEDRDEWYNMSKYKVKRLDRRLLKTNMQRRVNDPSRNYSAHQFGIDAGRLDNHRAFTRRFLTRATRENRLGEDKEQAL